MKWANLLSDGPLPLVIEPEGKPEADCGSLCAWIAGHLPWLEERLLAHGGLLFRGYSVSSAAEFSRVAEGFAGPLRAYAGGESPRRAVTGRVYNSTDYPSHLDIPLHNEMSYAKSWPRKVLFYCRCPPQQGGETPLANSHEVLQSLAEDLVTRFRERGVSYLQNLHGGWGLGKSWQAVFETDDRAAVEAFCREEAIDFRWTEQGMVTEARRPALITHPLSGVEVWFNQAHLWHVSSRGEKESAALLRVCDERHLPRNALHGDGSLIDSGDLAAIRQAYAARQIAFPWRRGDVLVLDNVLVAHGRKSFEGEREILVAMA